MLTLPSMSKLVRRAGESSFPVSETVQRIVSPITAAFCCPAAIR